MEKVIENIENTVKKEHNIYCDKCEKHIMTSYEYEDGWYQEPQQLRAFYLDNYGWLENDMQLCDECQTKIISQIKLELEKLGYKLI